MSRVDVVCVSLDGLMRVLFLVVKMFVSGENVRLIGKFYGLMMLIVLSG